MNQLRRCYLWLLVLGLALTLRAQPGLIHQQGQPQTFGGATLSNLRVRDQTADGTEKILTMDFSYDGFQGPTARVLPVLTDKIHPKVSSWFGANPVFISAGRGTVSIRVKYFNDESGAPPELSTDHVKIIMLTDGGTAIISQGLFARTITWGSSNIASAKAPAAAVPVERATQAQAQAEQKAREDAEANARAAALLQAEAAEKAHQEAAAKRVAEEKAEAEAAEKAHQEALARQLAEEKAKAEAEAKAREEARLKAEAEEIARQEAAAKQLAEEKATAEAEPKTSEVARLKDRLEVASEASAAPATQPAPANVSALPSTPKFKVNQVYPVNRNMDGTERIIAVEYQCAEEPVLGKMGVEFASTEEPGASGFFSSPLVNLSRGERNLVLVPVNLNSAAARNSKRKDLLTDQVRLYQTDANGTKSYIYQNRMMLVWHIPESGAPAPVAAASTENIVDIDTFKQDDLFSGYVIVKYNLSAGSPARLHCKVYDSARPESAGWFVAEDMMIEAGQGLRLMRVAVPKEALSPDIFNADTMEVQVLDKNGAVTASAKKQTRMSWAKPK